MSAPLDDLYQSLILDHNRRPRNLGPLEDANRTARGRNPLCGDECTLWLRVDGDTIADVRFVGSGCAISRASASVLTTVVKGRTTAEAGELFERFHGLVTGRPVEGSELPRSLLAFAGVARFPMRVKCASMAWHALRSALTDGSPADV
jgi:nitrogen fixation protein NifU and related proteins